MKHTKSYFSSIIYYLINSCQFIMKHLQSIKLIEKKAIAENTYSFIFTRPSNFKFISGQFVQFHFKVNENNVTRSYSICSTEFDENIEFCIKFLENGLASNYLKKMKLGSKINISGPFGKFVFKNNNIKNHFFIATGVGIAPIASILDNQLKVKSNLNNDFSLLFGLRHENNIFWLEKLKNWNKFENFQYKLSLSQPSQSWSGLQGRVTSHLPINTNDTMFYLCGNMNMVKEVRNLLMKKGVKTENICFEIF
ncbi:MAG: hypothetical protein GF349_04695 [Candidatus Magasanikbacteria bacterium]|nr:hypothetical protein [Candidatus Magasanikbacteria bacterium]